jgi:HAD superfamily hydrolase (TIGR01509 family)
MKKKIIFFDFDGVIADSFGAAMIANKKVGLKITAQRYRNLFNGNINDWGKNIDQEEVKKEDKVFFDAYVPLMERTVKPFPGIKNVISRLKNKYSLIIVSSSITSPIGDFMKKNKIAKHFDLIMGNDVHRDKTEKIKMVFKRYGVQAEDCIFITDTLGDMKEATRAGVSSIGVTWGFQRKKNLLLGKPFRIAEKPADLSMIISEYFK